MSWQLLLERLLFSQLVFRRRYIIHVHKHFCTCVTIGLFDRCFITARPLITVFDHYEALRMTLLGFTLKAFVLIPVMHFRLRMVLLVLNHAYIGFLTTL